MPLLIIAAGIALLLVLIIVFRVHAFVALLITAILTGLAEGMPAPQVIASVKEGVGSTLSYLALIIGLGAMLGGLIAESGAARVITRRLIERFGLRRIQWAMMLTGFLVGIPMFYTVAFLMLIPLIFAVVRETKMPLLYVAIPMIASLSVTHGFLPPHPAPTAIAVLYGADIATTLLYGLLLAVPTVIVAGPLFGRLLRSVEARPPADLFHFDEPDDGKAPAFWLATGTGLVPVLLMGADGLARFFLPEGHALLPVTAFLGDPVMAMLMAVVVGTLTLGVWQGKKIGQVMQEMSEAVKASALIMLVIAGGGAFKQVLIDSGAGDYIVQAMRGTTLSPLLLAWGMAAALRVSLGSATVAAMTAGGIVAPMVADGQVAPELLVLATGAGSLTASQVNDTGFWLFKEYFGLSVGQTLRTWTVMETLVSVLGLAGCLLLDALAG